MLKLVMVTWEFITLLFIFVYSDQFLVFLVIHKSRNIMETAEYFTWTMHDRICEGSD